MKILYYCSHPQLSIHAQSGPGTHMREMVGAMRDLGHEVFPVIMGDRAIDQKNKPLTSFTKKSFVKFFLKKITPGVIWRSLKEYKLLKFDHWAESELSKGLKQFKPDLVYERASYLQLSGIKALKGMNILHFMEINAPFIEELREFEGANTFWSKKARQAEQLQISNPDHVYVVSSALKKYYLRYTSDETKIEVTPNCVNAKHLVVDENLKKELISKYQLKNKKVLGFTGSIFPYHGVDILLRAFAEITTNDIVLLIVGDGFIIPDLKLLSEKLKIKDRVVFTGSVPYKNIFTYISLMDITIMAKSNWYCSPVKIFEYGAMKKAIIAPNTISVKDVMQHMVDGWLIDPDKNQLITAINALLNNSQLQDTLANNFNSKVLHTHTWDKVAGDIIRTAQSFNS